jgi:pilus assembly protein TadC
MIGLFGSEMETFFDIVWSKIVIAVIHVYAFVNLVLSPLEVYGPAPVILILVLLTVPATKFLSRIYTTRRYEALKAEFTHYYKLRQEALGCKDREKGKLLAKNIDQAKLNKVYYDFFFEGLLKNILTIYLPCLIVAAYINEAYKPDNLMSKFGQDYVFKFGATGSDPTVIGALFCYVVLLLATYLGWFFIAKAVRGQGS